MSKVSLKAGHLVLPALLMVTGCGFAVTGCGPQDDLRQRSDERDPAPASDEEGTRPGRGIAWVIFGADTVHAEIAYTPDDRAEGLMFREELPDGEGMLFVFDDLDSRSFWMQNTYLPLDIAFLDQDHRIVDIQQMEPETTEAHESAAPAMFALEVPQGWFEANGIEVGDVASIVFGRF